MIFSRINSARKLVLRSTALLFVLLLTGCYSYQWNTHETEEMVQAPAEVQAFFKQQPNQTITVTAVSPSETYKYDAWEKDKVFAKDEKAMHFNTVELALKDKMPKGTVMVDFTFKDGKGNEVLVPNFDLLRIVPLYNTEGAHLYPELLLEEFNRFGVSLRKEFNEFQVVSSDASSENAKALQRAFRASITNGCLSAGKWEFNINTEDFSDFNKRVHNPINYNQTKILAHSWFLLDKDLYKSLVMYKNPDVNIEGFDVAKFDYEALSEKSEEVKIDFEALRNPIKKVWDTKMLEVGHQSERPIELLDMEEHYKVAYGLFLNQDSTSIANETYKSILDPAKQPLKLAQFRDEGFYSPENALTFDMNWLQYLDEVIISAVDVPSTDCLSEIKITGKWSPFTITLNNIDLAMIGEQKLYGLHFGFNVYPKGRRYNPSQPTISYDTDLMPKEFEQSILLTDTKTGKWVDNFKKGLSKVYLTYPTLEKDVLDVYLVSYERITPLWMGCVKLPKELREKVRIRNQLYNY